MEGMNESTVNPERRRRPKLPWIPAALLVLVGLHQIWLTRTELLSPWKGGGFGMFSSTELSSTRYVRVYLTAPERSEELLIPESLQDAAQRAALLPSDRMLQRLAKAVVEREIRKGRPIAAVRIEVWRTGFEKASLAPLDWRIREYHFAIH